MNSINAQGSKEFYERGSTDVNGHRDYTIWPITVDEILHVFNITSVAFIKLDCEGCEYSILPALSASAAALFRDALVFGETHSDRMTLDPSVVAHVHSFYAGYAQSGGGSSKRWAGALSEYAKFQVD